MTDLHHLSLTANNITAKTDQSVYTHQTNYIQLTTTFHLTLMITSAQVVETSVTIPDNSPSQDYTHPDDQTTLLLCHFYDKLNSNSTPDFPKIKPNYLRSTNNICVSYNCNITINVDTKVSGKNRWTKRKDTLFQGFIYTSALLNPFVHYK